MEAKELKTAAAAFFFQYATSLVMVRLLLCMCLCVLQSFSETFSKSRISKWDLSDIKTTVVAFHI